MTEYLRGLDAATILTPYCKQIAVAGFVSVGRYLKSLTRAEVDALHAAEIGLWLIFETTATRALGGAAAGESDGVKAASQAKALGAPPGTVIYWTVDTDVLPTQLPAVGAYGLKFGAAIAAEGYRAGSYACGDAQTYMAKNLAAVPLSWLPGAMGWSGSRAYDATGAWVMKQGPQINAGRTANWVGLAWPALPFPYDPNVIVTGRDYGAWMPPGVETAARPASVVAAKRSAPAAPQDFTIRQIQQRLSDLGWQIGVDGDEGPETRRTIMAALNASA